MSKTTAQKDAYRVRFETADGCLVMNRRASYWVYDSFKTDPAFLKMTLEADSREHGVRVISYTYDAVSLKAIVAFL